MKEQIVKRLMDILKWIILIIVAATAFYIVYPKYYFHEVFAVQNGIAAIRGNKITGEIVIIAKKNPIQAKGRHAKDSWGGTTFIPE